MESPRGVTLAEACELWAGMPLVFQPGTSWNYSVATDVLGRLIEVASGMSFASSGSGLIGTAGDYQRFARMLLGGGELEGTRLLGPRTVAYMVRNHLPGGVDLEA